MFIRENYRNVRRNSSKLLSFLPSTDHRNEKYGCTKLAHSVWGDVERISTVHGVRRLFRKTSTTIESILLSIGFVVAITFFALVAYNIAYICRYKPMNTVISDLHLPVYKISFPEVTICNRNHLNWQRYNEAKDKFLRQQHRSAQHEKVFMEVLNAYDTFQFGKFNNFENISILYAPQLLRDLNYINFTQVVQLMAWRCHEILTECSWINRSINCCDIFYARKSQIGQCLSFNSIETKEGQLKQQLDPYYPWRTQGKGPTHGLRVRVHVREGMHSPHSLRRKSIWVMLVEPAVWAYLHFDIPTSTRAKISISAFLHYHGENTRIFSPDVRHCVFEDELGSAYYKSLLNHKYMFENCQAECEQEYLMKYCNCTVDLFYPPGPYRSCRLTDLPCLYKNNGHLQYFEEPDEKNYIQYHGSGMSCPCHFNCKSLNYFNDLHVEHIPTPNVDPNNTNIDLSVYFLCETIMVYKTSAVYPLVDLMAALGGMAGLCIGCSLVGITELLYFFFFDIPKQGWRSLTAPKRLRSKRESLKTRHIFVRERLERI